MTKLEANSRQKIEYYIDTGGDSSLILISTFKIMFSRAQLEHLPKHKVKCVILQPYKKKQIYHNRSIQCNKKS